MNTRTIAYIDENEDLLGIEIDLAMSRTMNNNFIAYCSLIRSLFSLNGIDTNNYTPEKTIYYINSEY